MKPIVAQAIEDALARLAADPGSRRLSATRLAAEAGVSRSTIYRAPGFLQRLRDLEVDRIHELETLVAALQGRQSDELRKLWEKYRHMAEHVQVLGRRVQDLQRAISELQATASFRR